MKSILYVGATLMIGASIYGFVDYKKTSHKKEFTNMYEGEKKKEPVIIVENKTTEPVTEPVVKKDAGNFQQQSKIRNITEKKVVTEKQVVSNDENIISIKPISDDESIATNETKTIEKPMVNINVPADNNIEKKVVKKKKKISTKLFSRAPIREDEELVVPVKTTVKKTENKEQ